MHGVWVWGGASQIFPYSVRAREWPQNTMSTDLGIAVSRQILKHRIKENWGLGLPWWLSGKEDTWQCRRHVQALIQEDLTCCRATKPVHLNCWVCTLEPWSHNYGSLCALKPVLCNRRSHCNEKPVPPAREKPTQQWRPRKARNLKKKKKRKEMRIRCITFASRKPQSGERSWTWSGKPRCEDSSLPVYKLTRTSFL